MKYIDYLWHLPIIAHVGGHVFVHSGPTESFNSMLDDLLNTHPDWSVEQCIDQIFKQEISRNGFNSKLFDRYGDSITATAMMSMPKFINDQKIVNKFLSFFDGAAFLGVGHNKALGVLGQKDDYNRIKRVGSAKNIVKLDAGTDMQVNKAGRNNIGRAYIVDPKEIDFVTTISEVGDYESLMEKKDKRVQFIRTEAALLYDTMLSDKSDKFFEDSKQPIAEEEPEISDDMVVFIRMFFMVYSNNFDSIFKTQTKNILGPKPHYLQARLENIDSIPEISELLRYYREYIKEVKMGLLPQDDISLEQFQNYVAQQRSLTNPSAAVSTKILGTRIINMENDVKRFYTVMAHSDIQAMEQPMIHRLQTRLEEKIEEYAQTLSPRGRLEDKKMSHLKRALYLFKESGKELSFKLLDVHNGEPCIFLEEGGSITGFVLKKTIYLSSSIVNLLWNSYQKNSDTDALDQLLALAVHELHEYRDDSAIDVERNVLHDQAEDLERLLCGFGKVGSNLDDTIENAIQEYKEQNKDIKLVTIKKFLLGLRGYLKKQADLTLYKEVFTRIRLPIEGEIIDSLTLSDNMFGMLIDNQPVDVFYALLEDIADRTSMFFAVDHALFSEAELLKLVDLITAPSMQVARPRQPLVDFELPVSDQPQEAEPVNLRKNLNATRAVDKSL